MEILKTSDFFYDLPEELIAQKPVSPRDSARMLVYKKEEDIATSEENPDVVNINEPCQHCGNSSGYTLIGKVDQSGSPIYSLSL